MSHWVALWGSSPSWVKASPCRYAKDITLRYTLRALLTGESVRLHLNNLLGREPAVIDRVFVQKAGCAAVPVTFAGEAACRLPVGAEAVSDPAALPLSRGEDFTVSLYIAGLACLESGTSDNGPLCRFAFAEGDHAAEEALPPFHTAPMETVYFLDTVDVLTPDERAHALICYGDSITSQSWPDYLALRALRGERGHLAVIRRGISGSRILRSYANLEHRHYGPAGAERFAREIAAAGADAVVVLHGINDIIHPDTGLFRPWSELPTPKELIEGLRMYIRLAHAQGMKIYLGTIPPIKGWGGYRPEREAVRHAVNAWIRAQREADGVADFDAAIRAQDDPDARDPRFDSGDHIHPSLAGAERMAESLPEAWLR